MRGLNHGAAINEPPERDTSNLPQRPKQKDQKIDTYLI